jgi:hypothetical protein
MSVLSSIQIRSANRRHDIARPSRNRRGSDGKGIASSASYFCETGPDRGGAILLKISSKDSPVSSMPSFRAASINRSDSALSVNLGFGFAFTLVFGFWALAIQAAPFNESFDR